MNAKKLRELDPNIFTMTYLTILNVASNQLTELPSAIGGLQLLQYLDLGNNNLTELPKAIGGLTLLEELHLHNNRDSNGNNILKTLPPAIANLRELKTLKIDDTQSEIFDFKPFSKNGNPLSIKIAFQNTSLSKEEIQNKIAKIKEDIRTANPHIRRRVYKA